MKAAVVSSALLGLLSSASAAPCADNSWTRTYIFEEWQPEALESITKLEGVATHVTFREMYPGSSNTVVLTAYAATEQAAQEFRLETSAEDGVLTSASLAREGDDEGAAVSTLSSASGVAAAATASSLAALSWNRGRTSKVLLAAVPAGLFIGGALGQDATCEPVVELQVLLEPALYNLTVERILSEDIKVEADSIDFQLSTEEPSEEACRDPVVQVNFPVTCEGVPMRPNPVNSTAASTASQPLYLDNVFKFYDGTAYPHQKCALEQLQNVINSRQYYKDFACRFRNQPVDGSSCGALILLINVAANYNPTANPHQKTAVDFLQAQMERETAAWQAFVSQWRKQSYCINWTVRNDGRCGSAYGNAGCNPERSYCCSSVGWCGVTTAHCNGGVDYRTFLDAKPAAPVTVEGPACDGNHPTTQRNGVCISNSDCASKGGEAVSGLCMSSPADVRCCDAKNFVIKRPPTDACGEYANSPTFRVPGNNGVTYTVVKILPAHLSVPSYYNSDYTVRDNTMTTTTACAFSKLRQAAANAGHYITINSGFRTLARQQYFWDCYQCGCCNNGNLAARPGTSNHGKGQALDLQLSGAAYNWMAGNAQRFGFVRTVPSETWHWEYIPGAPKSSYT